MTVTTPRGRGFLVINKWIISDKHEYAANILRFFEKRIVNSILRGPLVRLFISKSSARIDLTELGTNLKLATQLLNSIIKKSTSKQNIDPKCFIDDSLKERRTRRMINEAINFLRDRGLYPLYLGFPFLINQRKTGKRPHILPILLWPIKMKFKSGSIGQLELLFDRERQEIRLNPALENELGKEEFEKWKKIHREVLGKRSLNVLTSNVLAYEFLDKKDCHFKTLVKNR